MNEAKVKWEELITLVRNTSWNNLKTKPRDVLRYLFAVKSSLWSNFPSTTTVRKMSLIASQPQINFSANSSWKDMTLFFPFATQSLLTQIDSCVSLIQTHINKVKNPKIVVNYQNFSIFFLFYVVSYVFRL